MARPSLTIHESSGSSIFRVHVIPRAARSQAAGIHGDALKLRLHAPPVDGKANEECIRLLADLLGVKKSQVTIIAGHAARIKTIAIEGIRAGALAALLPQS
jgi:uncharacterized protein (TIGR00251 family)